MLNKNFNNHIKFGTDSDICIECYKEKQKEMKGAEPYEIKDILRGSLDGTPVFFMNKKDEYVLCLNHFTDTVKELQNMAGVSTDEKISE